MLHSSLLILIICINKLLYVNIPFDYRIGRVIFLQVFSFFAVIKLFPLLKLIRRTLRRYFVRRNAIQIPVWRLLSESYLPGLLLYLELNLSPSLPDQCLPPLFGSHDLFYQVKIPQTLLVHYFIQIHLQQLFIRRFIVGVFFQSS